MGERGGGVGNPVEERGRGTRYLNQNLGKGGRRECLHYSLLLLACNGEREEKVVCVAVFRATPTATFILRHWPVFMVSPPPPSSPSEKSPATYYNSRRHNICKTRENRARPAGMRRRRKTTVAKVYIIMRWREVINVFLPSRRGQIPSRKRDVHTCISLFFGKKDSPF